MLVSPAVLLAVSVAFVALLAWSAGLAIRGRRLCGARLRADLLRRQALERADALTRRLRLSSHDVRGIGMNLHGHADHLAAEGHGHAAGIAVAAADMLDLADELHDLTMEPAPAHFLRVEAVTLGDMVDGAVAAVAASILPGRRNWRILPGLRPVQIAADARALRHALTRVLADAVRNSRHDDWIDIGGQMRDGGFGLVVGDEGRGGLMPGAVRRDSRGISLRLTLARALVEAHGGRMEVESFAGVGSRVTLVFPVGAAGPGPSRPSRSCGAPAPAGGCGGR